VQPSEEIKQKLDIVDVIKDYIPLKAAGVNFTARCPFHREKSPSFMVSPEKQIFHCFGCGKSGDIFTFVMEMDGIGFPEALRQLAHKAGVTLKQIDPQTVSKRNRLMDILELSAKYYHHILMNERIGITAKDYLTDRGLMDKTIEEWQIGYSLDSWDNLGNFLKSRGFKDEEIFAAGMFSHKEGGRGFYDRFRGRIMFPLNDINGHTVAFTARVSPEKEATEKMGKYINSPQTELYDKSRVLFGLDKARINIKNENKAIIVEGQMDVITAHQHGFKNVVASSGTALTKDQLILIKRYSDNVYLSFDRDNAGELALDRGIEEAIRQGFAIRVIKIPNGKDPDECIKHDPESWKNAVDTAKHFVSNYIDELGNKFNLDDPVEKRKAMAKVLLFINKIENKIEVDFWIKEISQKFAIDEYFLREEIAKLTKMPAEFMSVQKDSQQAVEFSRSEKLSRYFLALLFRFPDLQEYALKNVTLDCIFGIANKAIYKNILLYYNNFNPSLQGEGSFFEFNNFSDWLKTENQEMLLLANELAILGDVDFYALTADEAKKELLKISIYLKKNFIATRRSEIEKTIKELEKDKDDMKLIPGLLKEYNFLNLELKELNKDESVV
jgi:DNA primase